MPNWGEGNARAVEARQRKSAAKQQKHEAEQKRKEEASWKDEVTDAKLSKKEAQQAKQHEKFLKKQELRNLAAAEEKALPNKKGTAAPAPPKMTRAQIEQRQLAARKAAEAEAQQAELDVFSLPNPNRVLQEEKAAAAMAGQVLASASGIAEAVEVLTGNSASTPAAPDLFLTKRLKAAYTAYEEEWMDRLRKENPTLKRSQLKERIWKQWQKAPENPMNTQQAATSP